MVAETERHLKLVAFDASPIAVGTVMRELKTPGTVKLIATKLTPAQEQVAPIFAQQLDVALVADLLLKINPDALLMGDIVTRVELVTYPLTAIALWPQAKHYEFVFPYVDSEELAIAIRVVGVSLGMILDKEIDMRFAWVDYADGNDVLDQLVEELGSEFFDVLRTVRGKQYKEVLDGYGQ